MPAGPSPLDSCQTICPSLRSIAVILPYGGLKDQDLDAGSARGVAAGAAALKVARLARHGVAVRVEARAERERPLEGHSLDHAVVRPDRELEWEPGS